MMSLSFMTVVEKSTGHDCAACRRSGHPARFIVRFSGIPYKSETLWDKTLSENVCSLLLVLLRRFFFRKSLLQENFPSVLLV